MGWCGFCRCSVPSDFKKDLLKVPSLSHSLRAVDFHCCLSFSQISMNGGFPLNHDLPSNVSYLVLPICILNINHNILKYRAWFPSRFLILNLISLKGLGWVSSFGNRKKYSQFSGCVQLVQCWASWYHHWRLSRRIIGPGPILVRSSQTKHNQS